ncbi:amidohydrolase family protein [Tamlana sp. 2201CG12-4]|uniref:amidohydrolase family protein n=1 Tax=Tamlana sp. 2201CG12-4 TaxID=3112582 RepID=UPI002DC04B49|nr:amidohydrolase family protein [Tamlana sp. 2201CG12-4]MEC3908560.1 amidohydrolase family protein [Tamlana sp. 2201CG12-4]
MKKTLLFIVLVICFACQDKKETSYDLVILNGHIVDPASGMDKVMNIGINADTISEISEAALKGIKVIDANGKTVIPGFIDLHTHTPFPFGESLQVKDGVTTSLDLEAGAHPQTAYGKFLKGKAKANYGASVAHYAARIKVIEGKDQGYAITENGAMLPGAAFVQIATPEQIEEMRKILDEGISEGGLGIGLLLDYMSPAISDDELRMVFEVAKKRNVVVWAHIRRGINGDIQGLNDVLDLSLELGTPLHICHINANAMGEVGNWLKAIDKANANGADISTEIFPYTAGSTSISADVFDRDWQTIFNISYEDVQWSNTGEWFTKETWEEKRKTHPESFIIHHYMKEEWIQEALKYPQMMIASDATPAVDPEVKANPNVSGSFTRVFEKYVKEDRLLTLSDAVARCSYYPAKRLEPFAPIFKKKGRIAIGAYADLLLFELDNLKVEATYTEPNHPSVGWDYVIVNGKAVVENGEFTGETPGRQMLAK